MIKSVFAKLGNFTNLSVLALSLLLAMAGCASFAPATPDMPASTASNTALQPSYANIVYAQISPQQRLDLYLPPQTANVSPVVIWIHGGGFMVGDKHALISNNLRNPPRAAIVPAEDGPLIVSQVQVPDVAALTARGYAVVGLNYRLGSHPASAQEYATAVKHAVQDAKAAVRFLRANAAQYHLDPDRFAAWGNSAGGYIASMLGVTADQQTFFDDPTLGNGKVSSAIQAVVDWFGPIDAASENTQRAAIPACAYLPKRPELSHDAIEIAAQYTPLAYIPTARVLPPFLIAHGNADCAVPAAQSQQLYAALHDVHALATLTILPGSGHEDPAFMYTQMAAALAFLDANLLRH